MEREEKQGPSRQIAVTVGILSLALALGLGLFFDYRAGAPAAESLQSAEGVITWVHEGRKSVSFRLSGHENKYRFGSKGGGVSTIARSLANGADSGRIAIVLHDRPNRRPILLGGLVATAYQLEIDGEMVRSWDETDEHWRRDNRLFPWVVGGLALGGAYLLVYASRKQGEPAV